MSPLEAADGQTSPLEHALAAIARGRPVTLIHGRDPAARELFRRQIIASVGAVLLAPSTRTALHNGAQTVHSFFGLQPTFIRLDRIAPNPRLQALLQHVSCIVIDDAPMLRADLLDAIDRSLRLNRSHDAAFGGVLLLLLGDFLQLPPIVDKPDTVLLQQLGYESHALFAAKSLRGLVAKIIQLHNGSTPVDPELVGALRSLRLREDVDEAVALINYRCYLKHRRSHHPLLLATRRDAVEAEHRRGFDRLRGAVHAYRSIAEGDLALQPEHRLPAPTLLELKPGARVMALRSSPAQLWARGALGTVKGLEPNAVHVRFDDTAKTHPVEAAVWQSVRHAWNPGRRSIEARPTGTFRQIPLAAAYATTVQRAQGFSIADIRIDAGTAAFSQALGYRALAAAQTLDGVSLTRPLMAWDVRIHARFVDGFEEMLERLTR
jgi:ATP-dependent DNA helicase PIF1